MPGYEKDRVSRMAYSSAHMGAKRDGGGAFNWGGHGDGTETVLHAVGPNVQTVTVAPAPVVVASQPVQSFTMNTADMLHFPTLGGGIPRAVAINAYNTTRWPAPRVEMTPDHLRAGAPALFDATHPRNTFAPPPKVVMYAPQPAVQMAIDWSESGQPQALQRQIIRGGGGPAHMNPFQPTAGSSVKLTQSMLTAAPIQASVFAPPPAYAAIPRVIQAPNVRGR